MNDPFGKSPQKRMPPSTVNYPKTLYLFKREDLKPYQRLEEKFKKLFDMAYSDYKSYKDICINNFAKQTQMMFQLSSDIDIVKSVIDDMKGDFKDYEANQMKKLDLISKQ